MHLNHVLNRNFLEYSGRLGRRGMKMFLEVITIICYAELRSPSSQEFSITLGEDREVSARFATTFDLHTLCTQGSRLIGGGNL